MSVITHPVFMLIMKIQLYDKNSSKLELLNFHMLNMLLEETPILSRSLSKYIGAVIQSQVDRQKQELEQKRDALTGILSQDPLYRMR